jgi:hypothetical protein
MTTQEFINKFNELMEQKPENIHVIAVHESKEGQNMSIGVMKHGDVNCIVSGLVASIPRGKEYLKDIYNVLKKAKENQEK